MRQRELLDLLLDRHWHDIGCHVHFYVYLSLPRKAALFELYLFIMSVVLH